MGTAVPIMKPTYSCSVRIDISMPCDQWFQTGGNAINIFRLQDEEARLLNPKKLGNLKNGLL
jgi:hypothetical protein